MNASEINDPSQSPFPVILPTTLAAQDISVMNTYGQEPIQVENGYALVPEAPGLGVEIDEAKLEKLVFDGIWNTPQFTRKDGSITEW